MHLNQCHLKRKTKELNVEIQFKKIKTILYLLALSQELPCCFIEIKKKKIL